MVQEIWHWIVRIASGIAALILTGVLIVGMLTLLRWLGRIFLRLAKAFWRLPTTLPDFLRDPWIYLKRWSDQSTLFCLAIYPFLLLYEKLFPAPPVQRKEPATSLAEPAVMEAHAHLARDLVDSRGQLTAHGIWKLSQTIAAFCEKHRYPPWRFSIDKNDKPAFEAWQQAFTAALAEWAEVRVVVGNWDALLAGLNFPFYLSEGEYYASSLKGQEPSRHAGTLALVGTDEREKPAQKKPQANLIRLGELAQTPSGIDALIYRLEKNCVAPYDAIDIPPLTDETARNRMVWTWANRECHPVALAWPDLSFLMSDSGKLPPLLIPRAWGKIEELLGCMGPLQLHGENSMIVTDEKGQSGLIQLMAFSDPLLGDVVGFWMQPCKWGYLSGGSRELPIYEASAQKVQPDCRGELVCDLIHAATGKRLNPEGIKVMAGTLNEDGCIAINEAGDGQTTRRMDRMNLRGQLLQSLIDAAAPNSTSAWTAQELRWADMRSVWEGFRPVLCPKTGLWGFIDDKTGVITIPPQFADVGHFHRDRALARPAGFLDKMGLIDAQGNWVIPPQWQGIYPQTRRHFVVQDMNDCWGAVDERGNVITALKQRKSWLAEPAIAEIISKEMYETGQAPGQETDDEREKDILIGGIAGYWHENMRRWVIAAVKTPPYTLAAMEGVFDSDAGERDLWAAGIWGVKVKILHDKTGGILQVRAGETGFIGTFYPVGLSCFDLGIEAPVCNLASHPNAVIGLPWKSLEAVRDAPEGVEERLPI